MDGLNIICIAKYLIVQILQRRRMLESQLNMAYNTTNSMQATAYALENAQMVQDQVSAQRGAMTALKSQHESISLDELEDMQDDMADLLQDAAEISDLMGRSYGLPDEIDEADLDAELEALDDELEDGVGSSSYMTDAGANAYGVGTAAGGVTSATGMPSAAHGPAMPTAVAAGGGGGGYQLDEFGAPIAQPG